MKVYTLVVTEDPGARLPWSSVCRCEHLDLGRVAMAATGHGAGPDPAEAAHDAMADAEVKLRPHHPAQRMLDLVHPDPRGSGGAG